MPAQVQLLCLQRLRSSGRPHFAVVLLPLQPARFHVASTSFRAGQSVGRPVSIGTFGGLESPATAEKG